MTNTAESTLARAADVAVPMHAGREVGGVACRSYQHTLALLVALERRLAGVGCESAGRLLRVAADASADLLERRQEWLPRVRHLLEGPDGVYLAAPACRVSSAQQSALMLREGPRIAATACESGDWSHVDVYLAGTLDYRLLLYPDRGGTRDCCDGPPSGDRPLWLSARKCRAQRSRSATAATTTTMSAFLPRWSRPSCSPTISGADRELRSGRP